MKLINLKENEEYLKEYIELCSKEWGTPKTKAQMEQYINKKIKNILSGENVISTLGLVENKLIGFISLFKIDGDERTDLTPWYATMYIKKEYRNKGYSKILNNAIIEEAKRLGYKKIYLKTNLTNYYEKFGAKFIEKLTKENLYYIDLK